MDIELTESEKIKVLNGYDLYKIMLDILLRENKIDRNREHFWVVGLENNHRILFIELISLGTVNKTLAEPMEVFSFALQKRASKIMLVHNHPTGDLTPSNEDKNITDRLIQVGIIVNTEVLDHLIIAEKTYLSFADIGLFEILKDSLKYVPPYRKVEIIKKQAREIGEENKAKEVARNAFEKGVDVKLISELTGLSIKIIENLKKKIVEGRLE